MCAARTDADHNDMEMMVDWIKRLWRLSGRRAPPGAGLEPLSEGADNRAHGLEADNRTLAQPHAAGAGPDSAGELAAESGAEHGVRGRTGGSAHPGAGTRPPRAATRHLNTALGVLSDAELAPHLATRVQAVQGAIAAGEFDGRAFDEDLLLELHRRICADLVPEFGGRWRTSDVVVGDHDPPAHTLVPQRMREYALDLQARLLALPEVPDDLWLETLAFAEGRLLSIHPFTDFNGRVSRVFIDQFTRVLELPDVDPSRGGPAARWARSVREHSPLSREVSVNPC